MRRENSNSCRKQKGLFFCFSVVLGRVECIYGSRREARESRGKRAKVLDLPRRPEWDGSRTHICTVLPCTKGKTPSKI